MPTVNALVSEIAKAKANMDGSGFVGHKLIVHISIPEMANFRADPNFGAEFVGVDTPVQRVRGYEYIIVADQTAPFKVKQVEI